MNGLDVVYVEGTQGCNVEVAQPLSLVEVVDVEFTIFYFGYDAFEGVFAVGDLNALGCGGILGHKQLDVVRCGNFVKISEFTGFGGNISKRLPGLRALFAAV